MKPRDLKIFDKVAMVIGVEATECELAKVIASGSHISTDSVGLDECFVFDDTSQGYEYWIEINRATEKLKPFGELSDSERLELLDAYYNKGRNVEFFSMGHWITVIPKWLGDRVYRIKQAEKPSINWDEVSDAYNYLAVDEDGEGFLFVVRPNIVDLNWFSVHCNIRVINAEVFKSFKPGNCDWKESLVERPSK